MFVSKFMLNNGHYWPLGLFFADFVTFSAFFVQVWECSALKSSNPGISVSIYDSINLSDNPFVSEVRAFNCSISLLSDFSLGLHIFFTNNSLSYRLPAFPRLYVSFCLIVWLSFWIPWPTLVTQYSEISWWPRHYGTRVVFGYHLLIIHIGLSRVLSL